jgi:hypothetical protein
MSERPPRSSSSLSRSSSAAEGEARRPPSLRVKVVPASFGLDAFEEAVWDAAEDALLFGRRPRPRPCLRPNEGGDEDDDGGSPRGGGGRAGGGAPPRRAPPAGRPPGRAVTTTTTLVVAAPDLFTDPALLPDDDGGGWRGSSAPRLSSPQAEFESDRFREFASDLETRLEEYSRLVAGGGGDRGGGHPTMASSLSWSDGEDVQFATFHPLWRADGKTGGSGSFPYPCVAVSYTIET